MSCFTNFIFNSFVTNYWMYFVVIERKEKLKKKLSINSEHFQFWTNVGLTGGTYLIKIIFDTKIEIGIFQISIWPSFNKF